MTAQLTLVAIVLLGCPDKPTDQLPKKRDGLNTQHSRLVETLLKLQTKREAFEKQVREITTSAKPESVLVLTHLMIELPWNPDLVPKSRYDTRMPKLFIERKLDRLVASTQHDQLSALYFRAAVKKNANDAKAEKQLADAKVKLIDWTIKHLNKFKWDRDRFIVPD